MSEKSKMSLALTSSREELAAKFRQLSTPADVATLLEIEYSVLIYYLYQIEDAYRYHVFEVKKRRSDSAKRTISAPINSLKIIQSKLAHVLSSVYLPRVSVQGFCEGRSILSNARRHTAQKYVLNLDLMDFFPSINFGRVRGMFMSKPYELNDKVSTVLAQICCFNNQLPQGAPTSPIVSNMICAKMDSELRRLAKQYRCNYTRYADDMTFSTSAPKFPRQLATVISEESGNYVQLGEQLIQIIEINGFRINPDKIRLQTRTHRQEVTGLVTNEFPNIKRQYIRQVRAMLHAWEEYGLEKAEEEHFEKYRTFDRSPQKESSKRKLSYSDVVLGKIEFIGAIRGRTDFIYVNFLNKLVALAPSLSKQISKVTRSLPSADGRKLYIYTEGCTDWMHMKAAFVEICSNPKYAYLSFHLHESDDDMGDEKLRKSLEGYAQLPPIGDTSYVFVFDSDNRKIINKVNDGNKFKQWAPNVFSFAIPVPKHRRKTPLISIEFYYRDDEITRTDSNGKRLFLSTEFDNESKRHNSLDLSCTNNKDFRKKDTMYIIDDGVYNADKKDMALPKKHFAKYVLEKTDNFNDFDFSSFSSIFDQLLRIQSAAS